MSNYRFNFQTAEYTLDGMHGINSQIKERLLQLEQMAERSLQDWTGDARKEYYAAKQRWNAAADEMTTHLESARVTLLNISDNYGTTEARARQIWENSRG
jgi:WXG100 family type VII secretion target